MERRRARMFLSCDISEQRFFGATIFQSDKFSERRIFRATNFQSDEFSERRFFGETIFRSDKFSERRIKLTKKQNNYISLYINGELAFSDEFIIIVLIKQQI